MTVHRPSAPQGNRCLISPFLASLGAQEQSDIALILHLNVVINWQLSKQGIRWPVSPGRFAGSGFDPSSSSIFWSYPLKSYLFSNDRRFKFNFLKNSYEKKGGLCAALLKFWFHSDLRSENSASCYSQGRQLSLTFFTMVKLWSRFTSNFYNNNNTRICIAPFPWAQWRFTIIVIQKIKNKEWVIKENT